MIDWEEVQAADSADELKEIKLWLFRENMRIQAEQRELDEAKRKFNEERTRFTEDMERLNLKSSMERQRLKEETLFFDKKMQILQDGFKQLDEDRRKLDRERQKFEAIREEYERLALQAGSNTIATLLFRNVNNPLAVRKRYKDLVKIFHPDNMCGDAELMTMINDEFKKKKSEE